MNYKMPYAKRAAVVAMVRIYKDLKADTEYQIEVLRELTAGSQGGQASVTLCSDRTFIAASNVLDVERSAAWQIIKAIDFAIDNMATYHPLMTAAWQTAIFNSCINPRVHNSIKYERQLFTSRAAFYETKRRFICDIAKNLGII